MKDILENSVILEDMEDVFSRGLHVEEFYRKSILVTGATGMLAAYLCYYLKLRSCETAKLKAITT